MLNSRQNAGDASSRPVEETVGLTTGDPAHLGAPSARKKYASPADWERHKEKIRQLYLDENQPLREVMAVMGRDDGHFGRYVYVGTRKPFLWHSLIVVHQHQAV
jgi:hypothetical protein